MFCMLTSTPRGTSIAKLALMNGFALYELSSPQKGCSTYLQRLFLQSSPRLALSRSPVDDIVGKR